MNTILSTQTINLTRTEVFVPVDDAGAFWTRADIKSCLLSPRLKAARHTRPHNLLTILVQIVAHPVFVNAQTVLVVDDGVSSPLRDTAVEQGKDVYVLDPLTGSILPQLLMEEFRRDAIYSRVGMASFRRLPQFDMVVTGCSHYQASGYVFSPNPHLGMAHQALRTLYKISARSNQVIIADSGQLMAATVDEPNYLRAHFMASQDGVQEFGWEPFASRLDDTGVRRPFSEGKRKAALLAEQVRLIEALHRFDMAGALLASMSGHQRADTAVVVGDEKAA